MKDRTAIVLMSVFVIFMLMLFMFALLVPRMLEVRTRARVRRAQSDLRQIAARMESYQVDAAQDRPRQNDSEDSIYVARSDVQSEMHSLQAAIEAYAIDTNMYPASTTNTAENYYGIYVAQAPELASIPTFRLGGIPGAMSLTTPIAYMTRMPRDPFAPAGATFAYYAKPGLKKDAGWILWSPGPDLKYDINAGNVARAYEHNGETASDLLVGLTYDPTNGTQSPGDIWRMVIEE